MDGDHPVRLLRVESPRGEFVLQQDSGDVCPRSHGALDHTEAMRSVLAGLERRAPDMRIEWGFSAAVDAAVDWSLRLLVVFLVALPVLTVLTEESLDRQVVAFSLGAFGVWIAIGMWRMSREPTRGTSMTPRELRRKLGDPRFPDE
jgi:hypothetical protein